MKRCGCCREWKPPTCFWENRHSPDGLCFYCKQCAKIRQRAWHKNQTSAARAREAHHKAIAARDRREHLRTVRKEVCRPIITPDRDFLMDLHEVLIEAQFLRGRKNPFARIQFMETGWLTDDTFSTDI